MHVKRYFPYMILLAAPALILLMAALSKKHGDRDVVSSKER